MQPDFDFDAESSYEQLRILSEKAIMHDAHSLTVKLDLAIKYSINNEKDRFFNEVEKCLSMNPNSSLRLGVLGEYHSFYGDWERGKSILDRVIQMNVSFLLYILGVTILL